MIGKKLLALFGVMVLGTGLMAASEAYAKCSPFRNHAHGCKNEIKGCIAFNGCANLATRAEKKTCRRGCKTTIKTRCQTDMTVCTASPSGALLDASAF